jgi:hypothetical protein
VTVPANALTTMLRYSTYTAVGQRPTGRVLVFSRNHHYILHTLRPAWVRGFSLSRVFALRALENHHERGVSVLGGFNQLDTSLNYST